MDQKAFLNPITSFLRRAMLIVIVRAYASWVWVPAFAGTTGSDGDAQREQLREQRHVEGAAAASYGNSGKEVAMAHNHQPSASRAPAPRVAPVFIGGVRYAQVAGDPDTDGQVGGMLAAYDASSRELWRLKVYSNARRPDLEGDVQDVWFRSLRVQGARLLIENERGEQFEVDPAARRAICRHAPAAQPKSDIDPISGHPRIRHPE